MLQAYKHRKISGTIRKGLCNKEDVKTCSIIGTLSLLLVEKFWRILKRSIRNTDEKLQQLGELLQIDFWPQWTLDRQRVEPDVFVRFSNFDLIIELKRNDGNQQISWQWKNEIGAYHREYGNLKPIYLIAISGRTLAVIRKKGGYSGVINLTSVTLNKGIESIGGNVLSFLL